MNKNKGLAISSYSNQKENSDFKPEPRSFFFVCSVEVVNLVSPINIKRLICLFIHIEIFNIEF